MASTLRGTHVFTMKRVSCGQRFGWLAVGFVIVVYGVGCPPARDRMPPGKVTGLVATEGDSEVGLDWDNPGDSDLAGVRVQRQTGQYPTSHEDGVTVYDGPGESCRCGSEQRGRIRFRWIHRSTSQSRRPRRWCQHTQRLDGGFRREDLFAEHCN